MLGIFPKLLYILTLSPFSPESGFWKIPGLGIDNDEQEELGSSAKNKTGIRVRRSVLKDLKSVADLDLKTIREAVSEGDIKNLSPLADLGTSVVGVVISKIALSWSENQTIIFLLGFAYVAFIVAAIFSVVEMFMGTEGTDQHGKFWEEVASWKGVGSRMFLIAFIAKIYYYFYPPPTPMEQLTTMNLPPPPPHNIIYSPYPPSKVGLNNPEYLPPRWNPSPQSPQPQPQQNAPLPTN